MKRDVVGSEFGSVDCVGCEGVVGVFVVRDEVLCGKGEERVE